MKNKELRRQILEDDTYQEYTKLRKEAFLNKSPELCFVPAINDDTGEITGYKLNQDYFKIDEHKLNECERIRKCKNEQRQKIEEHVKYLFDKTGMKLYFVTFTFNDDVMQLKPDTRKQRIRRLLNKICDDYILNIDFGKTTEREHYHAIIAISEKRHTLYHQDGDIWNYKIKELDEYDYGFYNVKLIFTEMKDSAEKLSRYITKLTMHSIKVQQTYVSVKKGSDYQKQKNIIKSLKNDARNDRLFKPDYEDILFANSL